MSYNAETNIKPFYDDIIQNIADYVLKKDINSKLAYDTARMCLMDALGCGILALNFPECTKLLGPIVPGAILSGGARVPATDFELEPVQAAFNIGTMIRWLDFNDTWLAAEWGHPSDNIGGILAIADYISRENLKNNKPALKMQEVLTAIIKAYEIQGIFALQNSFNKVGLDHVILVKLATAAVTMKLLGGDYDAICRVISQVFLDGQSLRTYRHAPNAGSRKSWAAGDATARGVRLALLTSMGEMGYPSVLTVPTWGFYDASFRGEPFKFSREFGSYVIEHILFKLSYPAEFHAQTAVECAVALYPLVKNRWDDLKQIEIQTHESAIRIISKEGPLYNPADRDHCLQYMIAIGLLYGTLVAEHYEDVIARDPRIDKLRSLMVVAENPQFSKDYLDPDKRSIANALRLTFKNNETSEWIKIEYPIGHPFRRLEGAPLIISKFENNLSSRYKKSQIDNLIAAMSDTENLSKIAVTDFMELF